MKRIFGGKVTRKSVTCEIFLDSLKDLWKRGMLHCLREDGRPCPTVGVHCPFISSLGEFLSYWAGSIVLGFRPCWSPLPFPSPVHISPIFHSLFFICH